MGRSNLQFVWPKDGYKGLLGRRGFWGRLNNIVTNRGPDIFLQRKGSKTAIKPDFWGNWDSYHDRQYASWENQPPKWCASRGQQRYDPHTRTYKYWSIDSDHYSNEVDRFGDPHYVHLTSEECAKMRRQIRRRGYVDPLDMGPDWHQDGPRRFQYEHDWFWQYADRVGENRRHGAPRTDGINPLRSRHQNWPDDLQEWIDWEL